MSEVFSADEELRKVLQRYLPPAWVKHLSLTFDPPELQRIHAHLSALLQVITTYVPGPVVQRCLNRPYCAPVMGEMIEGTLMMADISGFTAMSEKLSALGKEGAEEVTRVINDCFTALLEVIQQYDGALLKFGGDALLVLFSEGNHPLAGVHAAWQMQRVMHQFEETPTSLGVFPLRISIGLNTGAFFAASIGTPAQMEYFVTGRQVNETARTEDTASAQQVFIHENTRRRLGARVTVEPRGDGLYEVLAVADAEKPPHVSSSAVSRFDSSVAEVSWAEIPNLLDNILVLSPYIPADVLRRIVSNPASVKVEGEHRLVTVLFANILGMTEIIERLGPERAAEITGIINHYYVTMQQIVERYGGTANKIDLYTKGDKLLVLFGAPTMHEDDPQRAVLAALEMQAEMEQIGKFANGQMGKSANRQMGKWANGQMGKWANLHKGEGEVLRQRVGINTGHVFAGNVGSDVRKEYTVMGDAVNLAARLMSATAWGDVVISRFTRQRVAGTFEFAELPAVKVKGKAAPVARYRVVGVKERGRTERQLYVQSLVGREHEVALIKRKMDEAIAGTGQVLALCGEAGMGKSRLVEEIISHSEYRAMNYLGGDCLSFGKGIPYLPWIEVWRGYWGIRESDPLEVKRRKLITGLKQVDAELEMWAPVVGEALGVTVPENELTASLDAKLRRQRLFDITVQLLAAQARGQPLLLVIEDVHWIDEVSRELLLHVARQVPNHPIFLAIVYRPREGTETWGELPDSTEINLGELTEDGSIALIRAMLGGGDIPDNLRELVVERTQGNPFYVEEVVRALVDAGVIYPNADGQWTVAADLLEEVEVPDTIQGVIMSRIDRLTETTKSVLRVSAVIGRIFAYLVLEKVYPFGDLYDSLPRRLGDLDTLGLTLMEHPEPDLKYIFKHILTQEVAYESILYERRRELHRLTAECIEELYAENLPEQYNILAHHYYEGRAWAKALEYAALAGDRAKASYANEAAIGLYERALKITAREEMEIPTVQVVEINESLADVLGVVGEYERALSHYEQSRASLVDSDIPDTDRWVANLCWKTGEVCQRKGELVRSFAWMEKGLASLDEKKTIEAARLYLLGGTVLERQGKYQQAIEQCAQGLEVAQNVAGREGRAEIARAYNRLAEVYRHFGDNARSAEFGRLSLNIYEEIGDVPRTAQAHVHLANAYFYLGNWQQAEFHCREGLATMKRLGDVYAQALIANNLGEILLYQGDLAQAQEHYEYSLQTWRKIENAYGEAVLLNNLSAVYIRQQNWELALSNLQQSLKIFTQIQAEDFLTELHRHTAEAFLGLRDAERALAEAERSLAHAVEQQSKLEEGITRRVLGQIYIFQREYDEAMTALSKSLEILVKLDAQYETARTQLQLAVLYNQIGQMDKVREVLDEAMQAFRRLGARLDLREAEELERELNGE